MRIVAFSDIHCNFTENIPDGDLLIFAGDFSGAGNIVEYASFLHFIEKLPHKDKIVIAGNHDRLFETDSKYCKDQINGIFTYLECSECNINGLKLYGSPYTPEFFNWAFQLYGNNHAKKHWDLIPSDTDILITHGPPHSILDTTKSFGVDIHVGCHRLESRIKRIHPKLHIFGHIHKLNGYTKRTWDDGSETLFVNAALCNDRNRIIAKPVIIDYIDGKFEIVEQV